MLNDWCFEGQGTLIEWETQFHPGWSRTSRREYRMTPTTVWPTNEPFALPCRPLQGQRELSLNISCMESIALLESPPWQVISGMKTVYLGLNILLFEIFYHADWGPKRTCQFSCGIHVWHSCSIFRCHSTRASPRTRKKSHIRQRTHKIIVEFRSWCRLSFSSTQL